MANLASVQEPHGLAPASGVQRLLLRGWHALVRRQMTLVYEALSRGDARPALARMAQDVEYAFPGDHALGGTRTSRAGVARWFARFFRLVPGPFVIEDMQVSGPPWATRVVTIFEHEVSIPGEGTYRGPAIQIAEFRWFRAVRLRTSVDAARLTRMLAALAHHGVDEAGAPPIVD